jgi:transcriptional regulator with XRE-family HTH domain
MDLDFERASQELMRALRAGRSQIAFSRRLGFRSNVAAKWESGQRMPSAADALLYSRVVGHDTEAMLKRFQPNVDVVSTPKTETINLHQWLSAQRGARRLSDIANDSGLSRYSVSRFLAGQNQPRLPQFLRLVEALTGRSDELVDAWIGIEHVPSLRPRFHRAQAARRAMTQRPLCLAVLCLLDTQASRRRGAAAQERMLARLLECQVVEIQQCLQLLSEGGVIAIADQSYVPVSALTVDTRASRERHLALQGYWAKLAAERAAHPQAEDVCSYNVFSIARKDYATVKHLQREFYRAARSLIAASEPTEVGGVLLVQMLAWDPETEES